MRTLADFTPQEIEQFLQEFFDVVGARQYVGARYVPIFGRAGEDTVEWDDGAPYEPLTVVMHLGVSYVSRRYVPAGIQINETDYWVQTYRFNAQVEQYRQEVLGFQRQIDQVKADMESDYVPFPDSDTYPKYGLLGQVLTTLTGGETKWEDPVTVDAEIAEPLIQDWLDAHPEATTTVQDGAITAPKLAAALYASLLHGTNKYIIQSHPENWEFSDADDQPANTVYLTRNLTATGGFANLPEYGSGTGLLAQLNFSGTMAHGYVQFYFRMGSEIHMYVRMEEGTPVVWTPWARLWPQVMTDMVHSTNKYLLQSDPNSWDFADANDQPANTMYLTRNLTVDGGFANLPAYGGTGLLVKMNFSGSNEHGFVQWYFKSGSDMRVYCRFEEGTPIVWSSWAQIHPQDLTDMVHSTNRYLLQSRPDQWDFADANDQPTNSMYLTRNLTDDGGFANLPEYGSGTGLLAKMNFSGNTEHGFVQWYFRNGSEVHVYCRFEEGTPVVWSPWAKVYPFEKPMTLSDHTCDIFRKVVCCGDSYTAGYVNDGTTITEVNEDYAWPHYMETITGNQYVNCGHSGANVLTWQTLERGLPKARLAGVSQAYIIGLMINDVASQGGVPIGTAADIGTDAQTYYGGMSQIVEALHGISPRAKIFIQTCPKTSAAYVPYNQAVRDIVEHYATTANTHLLDLYEHRDLYDVPSITDDLLHGHYTALGYQQFAQILSYLMSRYINDHVSDFQDVYSLPTS